MLRRAMMAASGPTSWVTTFEAGPRNIDSRGWGGYTLRQLIPTGAILSGVGVRLTLASDPDTGFALSSAYIQEQADTGDWYDFRAAPVQLKFGGNAAVSCAAGSTVITDDASITIGGLRPIILSAYFSAGDLFAINSLPSWKKGEKFGDSAATIDAGSYVAILDDRLTLVKKVEILR